MPNTHELFCSIVTESFRVPRNEIKPQSTMEQLDLDSLALAELALIVHERLHVKADREQFTRRSTVAEIVDYLDNTLRTRAGAAS
ncbi:acyl carrier protein [Streptomyces longispororuber]|nr:acyl carrier protein [Streptomyces longispororuber]